MTEGNNWRPPGTARDEDRTRPAAQLITTPSNLPDEQEFVDRHRRLWLQYALRTPQPARRHPQTE